MSHSDKILKYLATYLFFANTYGKLFYEDFKNREAGENERYEYCPHGSGMTVVDKLLSIEINFDFIEFEKNLEIRYIDLRKLEQFIKSSHNSKYLSLDSINGDVIKQQVKELVKEGVLLKDEEFNQYCVKT